MKKHDIIKLFKKSDLAVFLRAQSPIFPRIEETQIIYKNVLQLVNECYEEKKENLIKPGKLMLGLLRLYYQAYKLHGVLYASNNHNFLEVINNNFSFFLKNASASEIQTFFEELLVFESLLEPTDRNTYTFRTAIQQYF